MAAVVKIITIIGTSEQSFAKAADEAVRTAQKTIRNITGVDVVSMSATVDPNPGGIKEYRTTVNVAFVVEDAGEN
ncbi:MAG TPA: dodecin family protein [Gaiellaceae bacterium]